MKKIGLVVLGVLLVLASIGGESLAADCQGPLSVEVSSDGKNPSTSIALPLNAVKYYLHVSSGGLPCSTSFEVFAQVCSLNGANCSGWKVTRPWGVYRSDPRGIARIDLEGIGSGVYKARFRPLNSTVPWSNLIEVVIGGSEEHTPPLDLSWYMIFEPGYTFLFKSDNHVTGVKGRTRLQIEEETSWCGFRVRPWRFTKDTRHAYWNPYVPGNRATQRDEVLRWMVVSPSCGFNQFPHFDRYFWAIGDKRYLREDSLGLKPENFSRFYVYSTTKGRVPPYNLGPKSVEIPYLDVARGESYYQLYGSEICPRFYVPERVGRGLWRIRIERDNLVVNNPGFQYNGPAVRIDFYEGAQSLETGSLLRESWYFVEDIGLVKIVVKYFNEYGGMPASVARYCRNDSDCLSDTITNPHVELTLNGYFHNPILDVSVSTDNIHYSSQIATAKDTGYYLRINNQRYTGYLEAKDHSGKIFRWLWAEDGLVRVPPSLLTNLAPGVYRARFRIWVPDDFFPNESRVSDTWIPWSNEISVTLR